MDVFISEEYVIKRQEMKRMKQQRQQLLTVQTQIRRLDDFTFSPRHDPAAGVNSPSVDSPSDKLFNSFSP